jgi:hypothetical protein
VLRAPVLADLDIAPGALISRRHGRNAGLQVQSSASLAIEGAPQLPVVMRGEKAIAGLLRGIRFAGSNSRNNRIRYLVIRDGGSERWGARRGGTANLTIDGGRVALRQPPRRAPASVNLRRESAVQWSRSKAGWLADRAGTRLRGRANHERCQT